MDPVRMKDTLRMRQYSALQILTTALINQCSYCWGKPDKYFGTKVENVSHLLWGVWQSFQIRQFGLVFHYFWPTLLALYWFIRNITNNFLRVNSFGDRRWDTFCMGGDHICKRLTYDKISLPFTYCVRMISFGGWKVWVISLKLTHSLCTASKGLRNTHLITAINFGNSRHGKMLFLKS